MIDTVINQYSPLTVPSDRYSNQSIIPLTVPRDGLLRGRGYAHSAQQVRHSHARGYRQVSGSD